MKMTESDLSLTQLYKMIKKLKDEVAVLKIQVENLQDTAVHYDDLDDYYRCQCG